MERRSEKPIPNLRLRGERERRGWSRNYVAERIGSDPQTVARWERGTTFPTPCLRQKLCELFAMSAEDLGLLRGHVTSVMHQPPEEVVLTPPAPRSEDGEKSQNHDAGVVEPHQASPGVGPRFALSQLPVGEGRRKLPILLIGVAVIVVALLGLISFLRFKFISSGSPLTKHSSVSSTIPVQVGDKVVFAGQTQYDRLIPNQSFIIIFFARNKGTTTWSARGGYALVCEENCLGQSKLDFGDQTVSPGQQIPFALYRTAPSTVGQYKMIWRLEHNGIPFGTSMEISIIVRILPGGVWIAPDDGATVGDVIHFAAHAYPARPGYPMIDHVNFTIGVGAVWMVACVAYPPSNGDVFACDANLVQLHVSAGSIRVSFDVYDRMGNYILAPNGVHKATYSP